MLNICGEPESPKEKACLRYSIELANNIHIPFQSRTFKLSSSKLGGLSNFPSRRVSNLETFANFQSVELSQSRTFIPFKLSISEAFKPSNFKPFEVGNLRTFNLATPATSRRSNLKPTFQTPKFRTFRLSFELSKFRTFERSKLETVEPSKVQTFKVSNSQTSKTDRTRPRQKFEV